MSNILLDFEGYINEGYDKNSNWQIKKFATKVKEICSLLTGIPVKDFEKEEVKSSYLGEEWDYIKFESSGKKVMNRKEYLDYIAGTTFMHTKLDFNRMTVRELLQKVGTDAMRDVIHPDVWVNALMKDYRDKVDFDKSLPPNKNWLITDVRFPNEAKAIKDRGGIVVRVNRPSVRKEEVTNALTGEKDYFHVHYPKDEHPSETALDGYQFDYIIDNSGSIEDLIRKTKEFLISFNLL
jgi:hypothetical protein